MPADPIIEKKVCDNPRCNNAGVQWYRIEQRVVLNVKREVIGEAKFYICTTCGREVPCE